MNSETPDDKLCGIVPVSEDWHIKANFLGVSSKPIIMTLCVFIILMCLCRYVYSPKSATDHGSIFQLRNTIGRTSVVNIPLDNFNACDDFFKLVMTSHILAAAMKLLKMDTLQDLPKHPKITEGINTWLQSESEREGILEAVCTDIVDQFTTIELYECPNDSILSKYSHLP